MIANEAALIDTFTQRFDGLQPNRASLVLTDAVTETAESRVSLDLKNEDPICVCRP